MLLISLILAAIAAVPEHDPLEYAFISHAKIADESDGSANRWPNMAVLEDGRVLVVWSRQPSGDGEDAILASFSRDCGCSWTAPAAILATPGLFIDADPSIVVSGSRVFVSCTAVKGDGINTSTQRFVRSEDNGQTWSEPYVVSFNHRYTCGKTHRGLRLASGTLLLGYSWETGLETGGTLTSEGQMDLRAGVMRSTDNGDTWINGGDTHATFDKVGEHAVSGTDEPAIAELEDGSLYMLMRTGAAYLYEARSDDEGITWRDVKPSPLAGSNAPAALAPFTFGERKGIFVVWNNSANRVPLSAAASFDGGKTWTPPKDIGYPYTRGQASYPSCVQAPDGTLLAVWQQDLEAGRAVRMARFSLPWLVAQPANAPLPELQDIRLPETPAEWVTYSTTVTPDRAGPPWRLHREPGTLTGGILRLNPTGGYYIDDQPQFFDGSRNTVVEARLRVVERDRQSPGNHSAAEIWMGGPQPDTSCVLYIREDAVSFNAQYQPAVAVDAAQLHTYRVWRDLPNRKAYLFLDDAETPVLACSLEAPYGYNINRILFGDSGGAADVSGVTDWAFVRWGYIEKSPNPPTRLSSSDVDVTIVALGDSTTAVRGPLLVYPGLLQEDLRDLGISARVVNAGVPGDTTATARERLQKDVLAHNPQLAIVSFGINDSAIDVSQGASTPRVAIEEYEANLRYIVAELRKIDSKAVLVTPNPLAWTPLLKDMYGKPSYDVSSDAGFNFMLEQYADVMRRVAAADNVPLVDTRNGLADLGQRAGIERLLLDGMHPNDIAHRFIADRILECITPLLEDGDARQEQ